MSKKINKEHYKLPDSFNDALLGRIFSAKIKVADGEKEEVSKFFINIIKNNKSFAGNVSHIDTFIISGLMGFLADRFLVVEDIQKYTKDFLIKARRIDRFVEMVASDKYEWSKSVSSYLELYMLSATSDFVCTYGEKEAFAKRHMDLLDEMLCVIESMEDSSLLMENIFESLKDGGLRLAYSEKEIKDVENHNFIDGVEIDLDEQIQCHAVYNQERILELLMRNEDMDYEEAMEWFDFNIDGSYLGTGMPYFVDAISLMGAKKEAQIKMNIK